MQAASASQFPAPQKFTLKAEPDPSCDPTQQFCEQWVPGTYVLRVGQYGVKIGQILYKVCKLVFGFVVENALLQELVETACFFFPKKQVKKKFNKQTIKKKKAQTHTHTHRIVL